MAASPAPLKPNQTSRPRLFLVPDRRRQSAEHKREVESYVTNMQEVDLEAFCNLLEDARLMWRRYRALVESDQWPAEHKGISLPDPDSNISITDDMFRPGYLRELRKRANLYAAEALAKKRAQSHQNVFIVQQAAVQ